MRGLRIILQGSALALAAASPAFAQDQDKHVRIVLNEDLNVVEPCMASQSNIGRVILQNIPRP